MELNEVIIPMPTVGPDKCPICEKASHPDRITEDKQSGKGCLKSIPKNLGCSLIPQAPNLPSYATAAHHLIPANQCLKAFPRLSQMCETVGYDVNNSTNGTPLPTCGQKSLNSYTNTAGKSVTYGNLDDEDKKKVAFTIMEGLNKQWHVGHHDWSMDYSTDNAQHEENYNRLVKLKLRDIEKETVQDGEEICNPKDGSESGSTLIADLNSLSAEIAGQVASWKEYFVSTMSYRFAAKYRK